MTLWIAVVSQWTMLSPAVYIYNPTLTISCACLLFPPITSANLIRWILIWLHDKTRGVRDPKQVSGIWLVESGCSEQAHLAIIPAHYLPQYLWKWGGGSGKGATQGAMHTRITLDTQTYLLDVKHTNTYKTETKNTQDQQRKTSYQAARWGGLCVLIHLFNSLPLPLI